MPGGSAGESSISCFKLLLGCGADPLATGRLRFSAVGAKLSASFFRSRTWGPADIVIDAFGWVVLLAD